MPSRRGVSPDGMKSGGRGKEGGGAAGGDRTHDPWLRSPEYRCVSPLIWRCPIQESLTLFNKINDLAHFGCDIKWHLKTTMSLGLSQTAHKNLSISPSPTNVVNDYNLCGVTRATDT